LNRMPLEPGIRELNKTNCVPVLLQAFGKMTPSRPSSSSLAPPMNFTSSSASSRPERRRAHAVRRRVALTNQTLIQAAWLPPFLVLHTSEDPLQVIALTNDPATTRAIESRRLAAVADSTTATGKSCRPS